MAHFALIDDTNTVREVIVISNDDCGNLDFPESEPVGQAFIASLGFAGEWRQTSYHANFRLNYAAVGGQFDPNLGEYGAFVTPDGN